jgi:hypothetical protein
MCARACTYKFSFALMNLFTELDPSYSVGKNRVRSMVNQLNAAVSSTRPTVPSSMAGKRTITAPSLANTRRPLPTESTTSNGKNTVTSPNRPSLQRAMTINNNNSPVTPSPPSTPNNNIPSSYKRK